MTRFTPVVRDMTRAVIGLAGLVLVAPPPLSAQNVTQQGWNPKEVLAKETYVSVIQESPIPELRHSAELGLSTPFQLPALTRKTLLREYNLELDKYRDTLSQAKL